MVEAAAVAGEPLLTLAAAGAVVPVRKTKKKGNLLQRRESVRLTSGVAVRSQASLLLLFKVLTS
jgi:hypothetical protein